jgi:hypothetical protein
MVNENGQFAPVVDPQAVQQRMQARLIIRVAGNGKDSGQHEGSGGHGFKFPGGTSLLVIHPSFQGGFDDPRPTTAQIFDRPAQKVHLDTPYDLRRRRDHVQVTA